MSAVIDRTFAVPSGAGGIAWMVDFDAIGRDARCQMQDLSVDLPYMQGSVDE